MMKMDKDEVHEEGEIDCNNRGMKTERNNEGNMMG
jgi:hypothetical protein